MTQHESLTGTLRVGIDDRVLAQVDDYVLGLIALPRITVTEGEPEVEAALSAAEDEVHAAALDKAAVSALPSVAAWREAYRTVGVNPNRFPCAAESLVRRVAKGARLPRINSVVDLCNSVSITTHLPVASCDVSDIDGRLSVRPADGGEKYLPLAAPDQVEQPDVGEIVYADEVGRAHSRRWNWRQSAVVRTDLGLHRLLITVEAVHSGGREQVDAALDRTAALLERLGVHHPERTILDHSRTEAELFAPEATGR
jgi:DNA/RNA-binding domain of Phe-tRNA-synthetase-like protein